MPLSQLYHRSTGTTRIRFNLRPPLLGKKEERDKPFFRCSEIYLQTINEVRNDQLGEIFGNRTSIANELRRVCACHEHVVSLRSLNRLAIWNLFKHFVFIGNKLARMHGA